MVDEHPVILRGLNIDGAAGMTGAQPPTLLERTDQTFIAALLAELADKTRPLTSYQAQRPAGREDDGRLKLYQPVHRAFNLVLFEIVCDRFGQPRLDPQEIESAGLVVRRFAAGGRLEGWAAAGEMIRGWLPVDRANGLEIDPDPIYRPPQLNAGHQTLNRLLARQNGAPEVPFSEHLVPLFVAPPEVCAARAKTILYGLVPVSSAEYSEVVTTPQRSAAEQTAFESAFKAHLSHYFKQTGGFTLPKADQVLDYTAADDASSSTWTAFLTALRQAAVELGAFGENSALRTLLNTVRVTYESGSTEAAGAFLERAAAILIEREGSDAAATGSRPTLTMPRSWPAISSQLAAAILTNALGRVESKAAELSAGRPRFGENGRSYAVQGFVRLRRPDGCPPLTRWSPLSAPFTIAPWFDGKAGVPPVQVALPNITDRAKLKQMKPNVAFQVPEALFNLLQNSPDDFLDGKAREKAGVALDWICAFNIPIITLCAFIVLNIFLSLFDLIFRWLMFIKICIPVPKKS